MEQRRIPIARIALGIIFAAGVIPLIAVAPGLGLVLKHLEAGKRLQGKFYIANVLTRLKKNGFIVFEGEGAGRRVRITEKGKSYLNKKRVALLHRPSRRPWDGYWRMVVFDIPERFRQARDSLRKELVAIGFKKLQDSVWISPDECEEYIKLLKADRRIGKFMIYLKTKDIEYGSSLAQLFRLEPS